MPEGGGSFGLLLMGASPAQYRLPPSPRRRLGLAAAVSLLVHGMVVAALLVGLAHQKRIVEASDTPATVELVMSPPGSSQATTPATAPAHIVQPKPAVPAGPPPAAPHPAEAASSPAPPTPAANPSPAAPPSAAAPAKAPAAAVRAQASSQPEAPAAAPILPPPSPPQPAALSEPQTATAAPRPNQPAVAPASPAAPPQQAPASKPQQASPALPKVAAQPEPAPASKPALQLSLGGIASDTNALVTGDMLLPPTADPKFRNRKPSYPPDAALRGEEGVVVLMIHVSPAGIVSGVDITQSSGYPLLDRAAREAVLTWHFLPAIREGQPVPFTMPMRIRFALY